MTDIIQWTIVAIALIISILSLTRKLRRSAKGKCDTCCANCQQSKSCTSYTPPQP